MPGELFGLFVLTGGTVAAVLAYLVWSHVSAAREKAREAEKEQRWRAAFGMAEESPAAPESRKPGRAWLPVAVLAGALAIGAGFMVADDGEEGARPAAADNLAARFPGPWRGDYRQELQRALSAAGAGACVYRYRTGTAPGEFLAYCPGSGAGQWRAYLVWLPSGRTMGPFPPSADLPLPE